jgi:hypothetical protein
VASNTSAHRYPTQLLDNLKRALEEHPDVPSNVVAQVSSREFGDETIVLDGEDDR